MILGPGEIAPLVMPPAPGQTREIRLVLPARLPWQEQVVAEASRFNVPCIGRRAGKSTLCTDLAADVALDGGPVGWFTPTFKTMLDVWHELVEWMYPVTARLSIQERRIELISGGLIEFWSLDNPHSGRGRRYKRVVIDEAAQIPNLMRVFNTTVRPTLTDYSGDAWFPSTPHGLGDYWQLWQRGQIRGDQWPDWMSWQMPSTVNPYLPAGEVDAASRELPELEYQQEYGAQFVDMSGAVFRRVRDAATGQPTEPVDGRDYVMGVDLARVTDYTVCTVLDTGGGDGAQQVHLDRFNRVDWEVQLDRLEAIAAKYLPRVVVVDRTGVGDMPYMKLAERLARVSPKTVTRGIRFSNANKMAMVQDLARGFEQGQLIILDTATPNGAAQFGELLAFEAQERATGSLTYNAPAGGHDDTVTSLMLAWSVASPERMMTGRLSR